MYLYLSRGVEKKNSSEKFVYNSLGLKTRA